MFVLLVRLLLFVRRCFQHLQAALLPVGVSLPLLPLRERGLRVVPALGGPGHRAAASTPTARLPAPRAPAPARSDLAQQLAAFEISVHEIRTRIDRNTL